MKLESGNIYDGVTRQKLCCDENGEESVSVSYHIHQGGRDSNAQRTDLESS